MCEQGERIIGLYCEPCPNCASGGECLYGRDKENYFCETCPSSYYPVGKGCTKCFAGSWTALLYPIVVVLGIFLYLTSTRIPAVGSFLARFKLNLRNQIRLKQVSTLFQIMKVVSDLSLQFPSWFSFLFDLLGTMTVPVALEPACVT